MERFMSFNQGKDDTIEPAYMKNFSGSNNGQSELPTVTTEDNGKVLTVVDGAWNKADASGGGNEPFVIDVSWDNTSNRYVTTKTPEEIATAITADLYNIVMEVRFKLFPNKPYLIKDIKAYTHNGSPSVIGSITQFSASNAYMIDSFNVGIGGPQGFGVYYNGQVFHINSDGTTTVEYQQIPEVI